MHRESEREARCLCGQVSVKTRGEPVISLACNCKNCQRRSGSPFGSIVYLKDDQVIEQVGAVESYRFKLDNGNTNETFFCPDCGATVYMKPELFAGMTGIGTGSFCDPELPGPVMSVWSKSKYDWVTFPDECEMRAEQTH